MTELLPHAWDIRGGFKGLPSSKTSAVAKVIQAKSNFGNEQEQQIFY